MNRGKAVSGRTVNVKTYGKGTSSRLCVAAWPPDVDIRQHLFDSSAADHSSNPSVCLERTGTRSRKKKTTVGSTRSQRTAEKKSVDSLKEKGGPSKEAARRGNLLSRQDRLLRSNIQPNSETSSNSAMSASCLEVQPEYTRKKKTTVGGRRSQRTAKKKSVDSLKENCEPSKEAARRGNFVSRQDRLLRSNIQPNSETSSNSAMSTSCLEVQPEYTRKRKKSTSVRNRRVCANKRKIAEKGPSESTIPKSNKPASVAPPRPAQIVTQQRACSIATMPHPHLNSSDEFVTVSNARMPCTRRKAKLKPLYCSTPSIQPEGKRPSVSAAAPPLSPLDLSVPQELTPSGYVFSPPLSAPLREPGPGSKTLTDVEQIPRVNLLLSGGSDSVSAYRSCMTSGDGNSLKDTSLGKRCQVQLGRVDKPLAQTPYFSCLEVSRSATTEEPQMVESGTTPKHSDWPCPTPPCHVTDDSASLIDGQSVYPLELITGTFNLVLSSGESSQSVAQCDSPVTDEHTSSLAHQQQVSKQVPEDKAAVMASKLEEECLAKKCTVTLKRLATSTSENVSTSSEDTAADNKGSVRNPDKCRPKKFSRAAKDEKKRRSVSRDRPGTTRKAFVSGQSVSRWKGTASAARFQSQHALRGGSKAGDCSITELLSGHHNEPKVGSGQGSGMVLSTPVRALPSHLDLSSLLANLPTPERHTWSRLKAHLSVHRKVTVSVTPQKLQTSALESSGRAGPADGSMDLYDMPLKSTPFSKRLQSRLQNSSAFLNISEGSQLSDAEKVYAECNQQGALCWEECILPERLKLCQKIGEGTFGEVFSTVDDSGDTVALKIIPIEGQEKVNGEAQKTFGDILHEIIISKELSSLKEKQHNQTYGFIGLHGLHCVKGSYPADLLKAWDDFDRQKVSENDRPDFFEDEQLFLILKFEFGGCDLENSNGQLSSLVVAKSILHQVTAALAVAEQHLRFEHRDLHWGNILVKPTEEKSSGFFLNGTEHSVDTKGVVVHIIDYSLSRLEIDGLTVACDISEDEELFMGQGDYQFDIYRLMREQNGNKWDDYQPRSNVMWLHYLCSKLLSMKYRSAGGLGGKKSREELEHIHGSLLRYRSATEALQSGLF